MRGELLVGCGSLRDKRVHLEGHAEWENLTTLDINPKHNPDVVWDLTEYPYPFDDDAFDEVHAYEVLEHLGWQGDYVSFFAQFEEFYRILKPDGLLCGTVPWWNGRWAWADPGHVRVITPDTLSFLNQAVYDDPGAMLTDYRPIYHANFEAVYQEKRRIGEENEQDDRDFGAPDHFCFILKAIKGQPPPAQRDYRPTRL